MIDSVKCLDVIRARHLDTGKSEEVTAMTGLAFHFSERTPRPEASRSWSRVLTGYRAKFGCNLSNATLTELLDLLDKGGVFGCNSSA